MARSRTLTNLIADVRTRTNQEASTFVTDAEITEWLNQGIAECQVRLGIAEGQPHFRASTTITVTSPTALYPLPANFYSAQEVTATFGGATWSLLPFMPSERAALTSATMYAVYGPLGYRIQAGNIEFRPATQNFTSEVFYVPTASRLSAGSDTWDGFNGYEMAPIYDACAQVMAKEESDPGFFIGQRDRIYRVIEMAAAHRDMSNPERVQDVRGDELDEFSGRWGL